MRVLIPGLLMLCLLVVVGVGLLLTLLNVRRTRQDVERRMSLVAGADGKTPASRAAETMALRESGWRQVLGRQLRDLCAVGLARTWGMNAGVLTLILAGSGGAGVAWLVLQSGLHLSNWISFAVTAAAFVLTPRFWLKHQQNDADKKFMEVFPDTIDMVIRMLRAGVPVTTAVRVVGEEAPSPVSEVFTVLADQMAIGISFDDALTTAGQRIGLADFRFFAIAISLQRATGGNLATTLDILSDIIRKRRAMRLKAKATTGEVRMSAYVLGAIPFVVIGGLLIVSPAYLAPMIADPRGKVIIAVSVVSLLVGFGIIRQMMRSVTRAA